MEEQYQTISKFDRVLGGLQGGNNLDVKAATIQNIEPITGEAETYVVQTVRAEYKVQIRKGWEVTTELRIGDFIVLHIVDKEGTKRVILPPKVSATIARQAASISIRARSNASKAAMKERMANGYVPTPPKPPKRKRKKVVE